MYAGDGVVYVPFDVSGDCQFILSRILCNTATASCFSIYVAASGFVDMVGLDVYVFWYISSHAGISSELFVLLYPVFMSAVLIRVMRSCVGVDDIVDWLVARMRVDDARRRRRRRRNGRVSILGGGNE